MGQVGLRIGVAIGRKEVLVAVVVKVEKPCAPSHLGNAPRRNVGYKGYVEKKCTALIFVEGVVLAFKVGDKDIEVAIVVVIADRSTHAPLFGSVPAIGHARAEALVHKGSVALILVQIVGGRVISDENIGPAIAVEIAKNDPVPIVLRAGNAGFLAAVDPGAVAAVVVEYIAGGQQTARAAKNIDRLPYAGNGRRIVPRKVDIIGHVQIDITV